MRPLILLFAFASCLQAQQPAQHTDDAPQILEGPQTPGTAPAAPTSSEPALLTNDTIVRMHRAGLGDELILQTISAQPGRYDTSPDALIALKQAGLSDPILSAIANKARRSLTHPNPEPIVLSPVNEIGVYYKDSTGRWQPMESEPVHSKSSGWIKNTLSDGIIKTDMNGMVNGPQAKLLLPRPIEFLIYTADGVDAGEYTLIRFRLNGKDRQFRTLTGGVFHSTGGAKDDEVEFTAKKIAPRTWVFTLGRDTPGAEYGILPPGTGNVTNGGKIYTFAISE
jgi:hypothetical protein